MPQQPDMDMAITMMVSRSVIRDKELQAVGDSEDIDKLILAHSVK